MIKDRIKHYLSAKSYSEADIPKKFWLVFRLPFGDVMDERQAQREHDLLQQLERGRLKGVKGISATREIILNFMGVGRNALLVMDGPALVRQNKLSRLMYDNPHYLLSNNMAVIYRLFQQNPKDKWAGSQVIQNIGEYLKRAAKEHAELRGIMEYYGSASRCGYYYEKNPKQINNLKDLTDFFYTALTTVHEEFHNNKLKEKLTKIDLNKYLVAALGTVAEVYGDEAEWIIKNDELVVPDNSHLIISVHKKWLALLEEYQAHMRSGKKPWQFHSPYEGVEYVQSLFQTLSEYNFDTRYRVRFIDTDKYESMRSKVRDRRRSRAQGR